MSINNSDLNEYAVGIVLFHPSKQAFERIRMLCGLGFSLYIFDNSPDKSKGKEAIEISGNVTYITAGKNVGLGISLSVLCATAYSDGHKQLLFLDQDTGITGITAQSIAKQLRLISEERFKAYVAIVFSGKVNEKLGIVDAALAISSGSVFNLSALKKIGWHNEKYFVDGVDYELCLRAAHNGLKVGVICNTPDFDHVTEQPDRRIVVFGKQLLIRRYSIGRIMDSLKAYSRLLIYCLSILRIDLFILVLRSLAIYIMGQILSRLAVRNDAAVG